MDDTGIWNCIKLIQKRWTPEVSAMAITSRDGKAALTAAGGIDAEFLLNQKQVTKGGWSGRWFAHDIGTDQIHEEFETAETALTIAR
jgi:hypothetical protein